MKKMTRLITFVCYLVVASTLFSLSSFGQTLGDDLPNQSIELHLENATLVKVLSTLSVHHRIPLGLERSPADKKEAKFNIDVKDGKLKDVLDLIVGQEPIYRWEIRDGVINFVPLQVREPFFEKLLETRISRFAPEKGINKFSIRNTIADLPEVRTLLESKNITVSRVSDYAYSPSIYSNKEVDLSISDTDVRGVLNKVVKDSEHKLWVIGWRNEKKDSLTISF
jgi:hypothetical protein